MAMSDSLACFYNHAYFNYSHHQLLVSVILTMVVVITTVLRLYTTTHAPAILDIPCSQMDTPVLVRWLNIEKV